MGESMRKPVIAGNWKMNKTAGEAIELARGIREKLPETDEMDIVLCPPFTALAQVGKAIEGSLISLGAQNMHWEEGGAFTGEISPNFLLDLGCEWVIVGHSERREQFRETDEEVNRKLKSALAHSLTPILCVGEKLEEREKGETEDVVRKRILAAFDGIDGSGAVKVVVAYEPIWAIGTGRTATQAQASEVHSLIRSLLSRIYDSDLSQQIRIQYGGSVNPQNISGLMAERDIDGVLVGGASLKADSFGEIMRGSAAAKGLQEE